VLKCKGHLVCFESADHIIVTCMLCDCMHGDEGECEQVRSVLARCLVVLKAGGKE
jgi:hypothetical protein